MRVLLALAAVVLLSLTVAPPAALGGQVHVIQVVRDTTSGQPRFSPPLLFMAPGDSVRIRMDGKAFASRLIAGMHPAGAELWWGQVGENLELTLTAQGVYGHKCGASYGLGLVGLIVVGDPSGNLVAARAVPHPPAAARVFNELFITLVDSPG